MVVVNSLTMVVETVVVNWVEVMVVGAKVTRFECQCRYHIVIGRSIRTYALSMFELKSQLPFSWLPWC